MNMNGASIGIAPNQVRVMKEIKNIVLFILLTGWNLFLLLYSFFNGITIRDMILINKITTPPNLFGIERSKA